MHGPKNSGRTDHGHLQDKNGGKNFLAVAQDGCGAITVELGNDIAPTSTACVTTDHVPNPNGRTVSHEAPSEGDADHHGNVGHSAFMMSGATGRMSRADVTVSIATATLDGASGYTIVPGAAPSDPRAKDHAVTACCTGADRGPRRPPPEAAIVAAVHRDPGSGEHRSRCADRSQSGNKT